MKTTAVKVLILLAVIATPILSGLGMLPAVHAQVSTDISTTIIPPSFELFANPGDSLTETISIRNESGSDVTYNISKEDFEASGDQGAVQLVKGETGRSYSLASWITTPISTIDIGKHQEKSFTYTIDVPNGAEPGGHYGAISIQSTPGSNAGAANVSANQVSLILLRVSGNIKESASVESFTAPSYSEYGPINFSLKVKNNGDVHIKPQGTIVITDIFGAKVAEVTLNGNNVLPGAERLMGGEWTNKNPIGRYTATLVANYGEKNQTLLASTHFTVFPKPLAIGIAIALVCIILFAILGFAGRKRIARALKVIAQG